jgi:hypothetical protein
MHPVTAWYLAEAKHDDMMRALARPRLPRPERPQRPERHGLLARVTARLHPSSATPSAQATPRQVAGCALPMGCAA